MTLQVGRRTLLSILGTAATLGWSKAACPETSKTAIALAAGRADASDPASSRLSYHQPSAVPIIRIAHNEVLRVRLRNDLSEATGLDWHGFRGSGSTGTLSEGSSGPLAPGSSITFDLPVAESGTSWFHPPYVQGRSNQTASGLAGVLVVEDLAPPITDDDIVLFLGDSFGLDAATSVAPFLVNGKPSPESRTYAPGSRLRLRLINGSTRSVAIVSFHGAAPRVIAVDGQPSELFRPLNDTLPLGPGARFDVMVDLPRLEDGLFSVTATEDTAIHPPVLMFVAHLGGTPCPAYPPIAALPTNPELPSAIPLETATRVNLVVRKTPTGFELDGSSTVTPPRAPLFTVKRQTAATLGITNRTTDLIGLRLHGQAMRLLHSLDDGWEPYWRDSILVPPGKTLHAAFMTDVAGRWLIESPFFDQATSGLRHWFEIA